MNKVSNLNDSLKEYGKSDYYPFHMPGHKRNPASIYGDFPIERDITEIEGFDNLHHAEEILKEVQKKASNLYNTLETFYSINGSTAALLSAISAATSRNGKILMARNCHKAVYHAAYLRNLKQVYVYPQFIKEFGINGGILPEDVDNCLKNNREIEAVLITSPTYDGIVSDVEKIAEICHKYEIPLIVDEAHGAHFKFSEYFPTSAVELGADLVIQSVHKTLPSMTQTALLHRCSERVEREKIQRFMGIYQSSSPSYILMASIDSCMEKIKQDGELMFKDFCNNLQRTRKCLEELQNIKLLTEGICGKNGVFDFDRSKILFFTDNLSKNEESLTGRMLHSILLNEYHLEMEMDAENYVTALTSVGDTEEGFLRLCNALLKIDRECERKYLFKQADFEKSDLSNKNCEEADVETLFLEKVKIIDPGYIRLNQKISIGQAMESETERMFIEQSEGKISSEFVYLYPPGIPILVPGEEISGQLIENMQRYKNVDLSLQGLSDYSNKTICVVKE